MAGMAAMTVAAVAGGTFVVTRDSGNGDSSVTVEDATELATDSNTDGTAAYSFAAATATAQAASSVVFDMEIDSPDGPMSATASFDRGSGRLAMDLDFSQIVADDDFFEIGDTLSFIVDESNQTAYVSADLFPGFSGATSEGWISLTTDEFAIDDDVFGDVFTNPLDIADVFGDVEPIDLGDETIDGELLRHFQVTVDDETVAGLGDDGMIVEDLANLEVTFDVWVDEVSQIRRVLFEAVEDGQVGSVDMWITVSSEPIDIALPAPDEVIDLDELFGAAFEDLEVDASFEIEED